MRTMMVLMGCFVTLILATNAQAQYYGESPNYGGGYRRCLSSYGINDRLARSGWYPLANVGQTPDGAYLYMRVARGPEVRIATVDGCTGRIVDMQ